MIEGEFDNERVEVCCVGKGTSSCEEIVKAKMAEIRRICDRTCFVEQRTNKPLNAIPREAQLPQGSRCMQDFVEGLKRSNGAVERFLSSLVQTCSQRNKGEKETAPKLIRSTHETRTHPVRAVASSTFPGTPYPEYSLAFSPLRFSSSAKMKITYFLAFLALSHLFCHFLTYFQLI